MKLGTTFIFMDSAKGEHLWMVISEPADQRVVIVNFTSWTPGCDETCIVEPGEHPFVRRKTVVRYSGARVLKRENLAGALAMEHSDGSGFVCPRRDDLSPELLLRVQVGATTSRLTPLTAKEIVARKLE